MKKRFRRRLCLAMAAIMLLAMPCALAARVLTPKKTDYAARAAKAQKAIRSHKVGRYGMVPIYGRDIADGVYDVAVQSTSAFFKVVGAKLTVDGDAMTADITIGSHSYLYLYMGTALQADAAPEGALIPGREEERFTVFTIPVPALNAPFDCAAYSRNRQMWYDRQLLIDAAALPGEALDFELPDYELAEAAIGAFEPEGEDLSEAGEEAAPAAPEPISLNRPDGEYSIEVNLAGGSGRANVSSPTLLILREGKAYARLLWSSPYYDYMVVGETLYDNLTTDGGNSTFEIPITALDEPMPVIADTTAMGDPLEIEYTLTFYAESIGDRSRIPQEAAKQVLLISLVIIAVGAVLNYFVKKKRK